MNEHEEKRFFDMLRKCGGDTIEMLLLCKKFGFDEQYARRIVAFMRMAAKYPAIWVRVDPPSVNRACANCGRGLGLLCDSCQADHRVP